MVSCWFCFQIFCCCLCSATFWFLTFYCYFLTVNIFIWCFYFGCFIFFLLILIFYVMCANRWNTFGYYTVRAGVRSSSTTPYFSRSLLSSFRFLYLVVCILYFFSLHFYSISLCIFGCALNINMRFNGSLIWEEATMLFDVFSLRPPLTLFNIL